LEETTLSQPSVRLAVVVFAASKLIYGAPLPILALEWIGWQTNSLVVVLILAERARFSYHQQIES